MKNPCKTLRNRIYFFFSILLMNNCSTVPKKPAQRAFIVEIKQMKFQPEEITIQVGDTVIWINRDLVAHDVTEKAGKTWTSSLLSPGKSWSLVVNRSANYYCSIHRVMNGRLLLK